MIISLRGENREFENGLSAFDVAGQINQNLKKNALCARINGEVKELWQPLKDGDQVVLMPPVAGG